MVDRAIAAFLMFEPTNWSNIIYYKCNKMSHLVANSVQKRKREILITETQKNPVRLKKNSFSVDSYIVFI